MLAVPGASRPVAGQLASKVHRVGFLWTAFVDRILKGARPGDLPVEQPIRFELIINEQTAKTLALALAPSLLLRADEIVSR